MGKKQAFLDKLNEARALAEENMMHGRDKAMVMTKLDEAELWASRTPNFNKMLGDIPA